MIVETLQLGLYNWIHTVTGVPVVRMDQNAPIPSVPYIGYRLGTTSKIAEDFAGAVNIYGDATSVGTRELTVSIQGYGRGARQRCEDLRDSLERESVRGLLRDSSMIVVEAGVVSNIAQLLNNAYEERALLEPRIRTWSETGDQVGYFDKVSGDATYLGADGSVVATYAFHSQL